MAEAVHRRKKLSSRVIFLIWRAKVMAACKRLTDFISYLLDLDSTISEIMEMKILTL
jgi:hypothetical protein